MGEERCSGIAVVVFIVLLVLVGLYHAYSRRQMVNKVKQEEQRQQAARDMFANELAENLGSLAMDEATIRAAHKSLGAISPEIKVRLPRRSNWTCPKFTARSANAGRPRRASSTRSTTMNRAHCLVKR